LTAVDLRDPRELVSPFLLADAGAIGQMRADIPFLERLGEELTRPVLPQCAAIDYIPSQYLCEFIKKSGYDGVVYRSSVSSGSNLALFDPAKAVGGAVSLYNISRVSVEVAPFQSTTFVFGGLATAYDPEDLAKVYRDYAELFWVSVLICVMFGPTFASSHDPAAYQRSRARPSASIKEVGS